MTDEIKKHINFLVAKKYEIAEPCYKDDAAREKNCLLC